MWGGIYRVSFIGQREIKSAKKLIRIEERVEDIAAELLRLHRFVEFRVGRCGDFDLAAAAAVRRAVKNTGRKNCELILVCPEEPQPKSELSDFYDSTEHPIEQSELSDGKITSSERWLIGNADLLVSFSEGRAGGIFAALKYAEYIGLEVYNIAEEF